MKKSITVDITDVEYPNISVARLEDGKKIKIKNGILGQKVEIKKSKKNKGKIINIIEHSKLENSKIYCPNEKTCGGCSYQRVPYETELLIKLKMIKNLFKSNEINFDKISITQSPKITEYRDKMEYTFGDEEKGGILQLGLHKKNKFYEIGDTEECNIVDEDFEMIRKFVLEYFRRKNTKHFHKIKHDGLLRSLIVRKALNTGEIMVNLVTTSNEEFDLQSKNDFARVLKGANVKGKIVSIIHTINDSISDAVIAEKIELLYGKNYITEEMMGLKFKISPFSFFQPNVYTAEKLYKKALEFASINKQTKVLDLYSGTGTITQIMAKEAKEATGIELVEEAVEMAKENAKINNIKNINFICGDVLEKIDDLKNKFDVIVLDPPREGIHPKAINKIIEFNPEKFVYISCNPKTQVRDMKIFLEKGYELLKYEAIDQFPKTRHVETIALMSRK
ncbi:MAG: 23S rRNA (uracil(1939)-C(5))-methyltransferase RlmD [Peptoniphilaceae bacterium]|nr:23S rRNA (uracil(1939)-C(5))-methyltransferase RlmD [Peptoniphilaceae bacterium]MDD7383225.1 23S rRNA (uracil(1939)-C(5))-methyltransferase RlmD [Peptoniphilaceae bacterium]MDY3738449.1 23S rRNA (uracil(1939)-C(5))-methyltransferase RlmD [Peptoniphilaceae bacterium]